MATARRAAVVLIVAFAAFAGAEEPDYGEGTAGASLDFLDDIARALGAEGSAYRLDVKREMVEIEAALRPTLAALSRSGNVPLGPAAVRYALHRFFSQRRGWLLAGVDPEGQAWNSSSPSQADVFELMPSPVSALVERRLTGGLLSADVVVLAATIEHFVHDEADGRLRQVYKMLRLPSQGDVSKQDALRAVDLYMASYILGSDFGKKNPNKTLQQFRQIDQIYPGWPETQHFVHKVVESQQQDNTPGASFSFADVARSVEELGDKYGSFQNGECRALKHQLLQLEEPGSTGRVRLADFYGQALHGDKWQFTESAAYLRQLGALDESSPGNPRVIIPNYIDGMSNCVGTSHFHASCCISECGALMEQVESRLGLPVAEPATIASIVAGIGSPSSQANRTLAPVLLTRLQAIASVHDGRVPIYGRLFAQWMHHAYPRECPFPHVSGTTAPKHLEDYAGAGRDPVASRAEMHSHAAVGRRVAPEALHGSPVEAPIESAPWIGEEELFVPLTSEEMAQPPATAAINFFVSVAAMATLVMGLGRSVSAARRARRSSQVAKKAHAAGALERTDLMTV